MPKKQTKAPAKKQPKKQLDSLGVDLLVTRHETAGWKPGPPTDPESDRSKVAAGTARYLKAALPTELHKRLHIASVTLDRTASAIVTDALTAYLDSME